jgi:hypothetical protein
MMSAAPLSSTLMKAISLRATSGAHSPNNYYAVGGAYQDAQYVYLSGDTYATPKDGTKIRIPVFRELSAAWTTPQLTTALTSTSTSCDLNTLALDFDRNNLHWLIDNEVIATNAVYSGLSVPIVARGLFGTTATSHSIGAYMRPVRHSLWGQVHVPIVLANDFDHLFSFDIWFGPETTYAKQGHSNPAAKSFRLEWPGDGSTVYLQGSHAAYNSTAPSIDCGPFEYWWGGPTNYTNAPTKDKPMSPLVARPTIIPNRWLRHWILIKQRSGALGLDQFYSWTADEATGPTMTHNGTQISCETYGATTGTLRLIEFHSSADGRIIEVANPLVIPPERVWYMRNYVHLKLTADTDISSLLIKPEP